MDHSEQITKLLQQAGLPDFPIDENGFPLPGPVIRYFRERMVYIGGDGKSRHWSQAYLARHLHVSELRVRLMETKNEGLQHMERRQLIAQLLKIPPALLGLASYQHLEEYLQGGEKKSSTTRLVEGDIQLYHDILPLFKSAYEQSVLQSKNPEAWIARIYTAIEQAHGNTKQQLLRVLWEYHILAARMYYHDVFNIQLATRHLDTAREIAVQLNDNELQAASHYYLAEMYLERGRPLLAKDELNGALLTKSVNPQARGRLLTYTALATAMMPTPSLADSIDITNMLKEAEGYANAPIVTNDASALLFNPIIYLEDKAEVFIALKRYDKAIEALEDAEDYSNTRKRGIEYLRILRAECYIKQTRPEYEHAVSLLLCVLEDNRVHPRLYRVQYVDRLYKLLLGSKYHSPDIADIGQKLREIKKRA